MALTYLTHLTNQNKYTSESDGTKYERFKFDYEYLKLQLEFNPNSESLAKFINDFLNHIES